MVGRWALFFVALVAGIVGAIAASFWLPQEPREVRVPLPAPTVTVKAAPPREGHPYPRAIGPTSVPLEVLVDPEEEPRPDLFIPRRATVERWRMTDGGTVVTWTQSDPPALGLAIWVARDAGTRVAWRSEFAVQEQILGCRSFDSSRSRRQGRSWADYFCVEELGTLIGFPRSPMVEPTVCGPSIDSSIGFAFRELTNDGRDDLFVSQGGCGSGGYTAWRVIADTGEGWQQIYRHVAGDTQVRARRGVLALRESVYTEDDAHCCPSSFRLTTLEWDGSKFRELTSRTIPANQRS